MVQVVDAPAQRGPRVRRGRRLTVFALCALALLVVGGALYVIDRTRVRSAPHGALDAPADGAVLAVPTELGGWALDAGSPDAVGIERVDVYVDDSLLGAAAFGQPRPDIAAAFGERFAAAGFSAPLDPRTLEPGQHRLAVHVRSALSGQDTVYERTVEVVRASTPRGALDAPANGDVLTGGFEVRGWAIDQQATEGSGVAAVELFVDGQPLGQATLGRARPDVADSFGAQFATAGWSAVVDLSGRALGEHVLEARARSALNGVERSYTATVVVARPSAPHGAFDEPAEGAAVRGTIALRGWALDEAVADGPGVDRVQVYVDGALVADADYGQTRPELAEAYGARFSRAGWSGEVDTTALRAGEHVLEARARSTATGDEAGYTRRVVVGR